MEVDDGRLLPWLQGRTVQKQINAKVDQSFYFCCFKTFFTAKFINFIGKQENFSEVHVFQKYIFTAKLGNIISMMFPV